MVFETKKSDRIFQHFAFFHVFSLYASHFSEFMNTGHIEPSSTIRFGNIIINKDELSTLKCKIMYSVHVQMFA